jgi:hypothetical protein
MKIEELELVESSAPSEAEKEAAHGVRAGYVGAPATPGVMAPHCWREGGGRERERVKRKDNEENLWIMMKTWINWRLNSEPLGTSWPEGGIGCSSWKIVTVRGGD